MKFKHCVLQLSWSCMNSSYIGFLQLDAELELNRNVGFVFVLLCLGVYMGVFTAAWSNLSYLDILCTNYRQRISVGVMDNANN